MLRSILHCDMNNFYASVECMIDPALKKYPIAVCGSVEERHGIVLAKNYKAKAFDVKPETQYGRLNRSARIWLLFHPIMRVYQILKARKKRV